MLACKNLSKAFGITSILKQISFHLESGEKAGLVGINGAGKTTLFRIITGELFPDEGQVIIPTYISVGYLSQQQALNSDSTIYDEMLTAKKEILDIQEKIRLLEHRMKDAHPNQLDSLMNEYSNLTHRFELQNGYSYKSEIEGVLKGLGFDQEDHKKMINTLSGGQKTRVSLAKLLLTRPDLLLLDEPTNHLDMKSINWLESYIQNYKGTLLIISHDRYFLDKLVGKIIEIENGTSQVYIGNYSDYAQKKAIERDIKLKHYLNQQKEIERQEAVIQQLRAFNREKSIKRANSREKLLSKVERIDKPLELNAEMNLTFAPQITSGNDVLSVKKISKRFDKFQLFEHLSFDIKRGEKIALIGDNGTGKTTLFKIILNELSADVGGIQLGAKVKCGYYDQEHQTLKLQNNLIEEISDAYPSLRTSEIRNILAAFLFTGDDVFKKVQELSGGEKGRLSLAKLMLSESNFLLLDEPTNHLDITSKEILENTLSNYTGTIFYISHDRYFINKTATRVLELTPNGIVSYLGNYDYFLEKKAQLEQEKSIDYTSLENEKSTSSKEDWRKKKEEQAKERKRIAELEKIEQTIQNIEFNITKIEEQLCLEEIYTDHIKLNELTEEKLSLSSELEKLYEEWESLSN